MRTLLLTLLAAAWDPTCGTGRHPPRRLLTVARDAVSTVETLNTALAAGDTEALLAVFAPDADMWIAGERVATSRTAIPDILDNGIWSEVTPGEIGDYSISRLTASVAVVRGAWTRYGSLIVKQTSPVTLLLKRQPGGGWRITSLRLGSPQSCPNYANQVPLHSPRHSP